MTSGVSVEIVRRRCEPRVGGDGRSHA